MLKLLPQIGKRCPDDVLVTGVNDVDLATLVSPTLTTVHQPCEAIAQTECDDSRGGLAEEWMTPSL